MPGHSHRVAPPFDLDRARGLLREAGYPDARELGEIVLACLDLEQDLAADVADQLTAIGIRARIVAVASDPELEIVTRDHAHAFVMAFGADYPDARLGLLDPLSHLSPLYRDSEIDELLARAGSIRDQDGRLRIYREFERIWIGQQAAVVPLAYGDSVLWQRPWITGLWVNPTQISTFTDAVVTRPVANPAKAGPTQ